MGEIGAVISKCVAAVAATFMSLLDAWNIGFVELAALPFAKA